MKGNDIVMEEPKKRLSIIVPAELHKKLRLVTAEHDETISQFVIDAVTRKLESEDYRVDNG